MDSVVAPAVDGQQLAAVISDLALTGWPRGGSVSRSKPSGVVG